MKNYSIGQVVYVVLSKKTQVYPMQIIEVITKKTLQGEEVRYALLAGSDRSTSIFMDQIDGEVFDSSEAARNALVKRATTMVNKLVDAAVDKASQWYSQASSEPQTIDDLPEFTTTPEVSDDTASVMLPDGTVAKIKLPGV